MTIWFQQRSLEEINAGAKRTLVAHVGIEILALGDDFIRGRMPVDERTVQPAGILHGGASVVLAETLGSIAANLCVDPSKQACVGLEINANHVRPVRSGFVYGIARPLHIGGRTQLWEIRIEDEAERLVCVSRLTMAVLDHQRG